MARTQAHKKGNTSGQYSFAKIPSVSIPRSTFDRSCGVKTTFDSGFLVPVFMDEALPGDTFSMSAQTFARMATPLHPVMDTLKLDMFFFAVPVRLLWDNWQKFNGEQTDPGDSTDFLVPTVPPGVVGQPVGSLWDHLGLPVGVPDIPNVSAFWHRAYNLIWNEWFRDQNLQDSVPIHTDDGPDPAADYMLLRRGKRHDYYTSCLPWPQKGPSVELPIGSSAPVTIDTWPITSAGSGIPTWDVDDALATPLRSRGGTKEADWGSTPTLNATATWDDPKLELLGATGTADLSSATASTINEIREAFQIQKLYERDARGGTRYTEILRSHFGVTSPDARLQRPEYLGGGSSPVNFSPIPQTSQSTTGGDPSLLGELAAYVTSSGSFPGWIKSFTEHCVVLGMVSVRADLNYQQNIPRMFSRRTRWDYYWPALAHIGEQAVLNKEIFYEDELDPANELVFGFQERWAEYRYKPSIITGAFRSPVPGHATSLDTWHLAQDFDSLPLLNATFIEDTPPVARVIAVVDEPEFLFDAYFNFKCTRPMPTYSVPGQIDHF